MGISLALVILAIVIRSICQYYLGAEHTSLNKILSGIDYPFYQGWILGNIIIIFFQDNWNNMWDYLHKSLVLRLDSGDEDSGNEGLKSSRKEKLTDSNNNKAIDKGKSLEQIISKQELPITFEGRTIETKKELSDFMAVIMTVAYEISLDTKNASNSLLKLGDSLKSLGVFEFEKLNIHNPVDVEAFFIKFFQEHGKTYNNAQMTRSIWIKARSLNLLPENRVEIENHLKNLEAIKEKYISKISGLGNHQDPTTQVKLFYSALNEKRNLINKELNKADDIIFKDLKKSAFCTLSNEDSKNLVKTLRDYTNAKYEFNTQDNKLKKRLGEVINKKN